MRLTDEQISIINREYDDGVPVLTIWKTHDIPKNRIFEYLKDAGKIRKGGAVKTITSEMENECIELYKSGLSSSQIHIQAGISKTSIINIIKNAGCSRSLSESQSYRSYPDDIKQLAFDLYEEGYSTGDICEIIEVSHPSNIIKWLKQANIHIRSRSEAAKISNNHFMRGKHGDEHPMWNNGSSYTYCPLFNDEFRERVRSFFNYTCPLCGKHQDDEKRRLHVHHIHYKKDSCCNPDSPRLFIALCHSCHMKTNKNREYWENHLSSIISTKFNNKCYYTKSEYDTLITQ